MIVEPISRVATYRPLSPMQFICACLLADGMNYPEIAAQLGIKVSTVKYYVACAARRIPGDLPAGVRVMTWARGANEDVLLGKSLRFEMAQRAVNDRRVTRKGLRPPLPPRSGSAPIR